MFQIILQSFRLGKRQSLNGKVFFLAWIESAPELVVDLGDLEVLPESCDAQCIITDVDDLHERVVSFCFYFYLAFLGWVASAFETCAVWNFLLGSYS